MMCERIYFKASEKVVFSVVRYLCTQVKILPSGTKSLEHILLVVPTAQSGRRLRHALARECSAVVPPKMVLPAELALPDDEKNLASRTDELIAFYCALGNDATLDLASQYVEVRAQLGANALMFSDVAQKIEAILPAEIVDFELARWKELSALEERYLNALKFRGKTDRILKMKETIENVSLPDGTEKIVIACVLDPIPVMNKVLESVRVPCIELMPEKDTSQYLPLMREQIAPAGTVVSECEKIASMFASVSPRDALPSICLADASVFRELQTAFSGKDLSIHNPSKIPLVTSSLGHLVAQVAMLVKSSSYLVFSAFIRSGDVRRYFQKDLSLNDERYARALQDLDDIQAKVLPEKIEDIEDRLSGDLKAIFDKVNDLRNTNDIRDVLCAVFSSLVLDEHDADAREFATAAELVNDLLDECFDESVPEELRFELFARRIEEASYSLEPDEGEIIQTDGWLELPYVDADELVIAGFQEGCVPEAVVGHAFLPDMLRKALGLPCNETRALRDREILRLALQCRKKECVTITFHSIDSAGDVVRPSRLLFLCEETDDLISRVKTFYRINSGSSPTRNPDLPEAWRLNLKIPMEREEIVSISPTAIDHYLACPFNYFLEKTFGDERDDRAEELNAREFGDVVHNALERWGLGESKDSEDPEEIKRDLANAVDEILAERFGASVPTIVSLQGESIKERLANFAQKQACHRQEGWLITDLEKQMTVKYGNTTIHGRLDRIDFRPSTGEWCVIDYKTWDRVRIEKESVQLPLYIAMLDANGTGKYKDARRENISSCYCIIGKTSADVKFSEAATGDSLPEAEEIIRNCLERIERGIFWPPAKGELWRGAFSSFIFQTPEDSVSHEWLEDQKRRVEKWQSMC